MAALLGEASEAQAYFERARVTLHASGQLALRVAVDLYEAQALERAGSTETGRMRALLEAVIGRAREMGLEGWEERARETASRARISRLRD